MGEAKIKAQIKNNSIARFEAHQANFRSIIESIGLGTEYQALPSDPKAAACFDAVRKDFKWAIHSAYSAGVPLKEPIAFGFVNDSQINAVAGKSDQGYFIALYSGLIYQLYNLSRALANDSEFYKIIPGEVNKVTFDPLAYDADCSSPIGRVPEPIGEYRKNLAGELFRFAIRFVYGHEIAHITSGHVDWINAQLGASSLHEKISLNSKDISGIDFQAMEVYADWVSFSEAQLNHISRIRFLPRRPNDLSEHQQLFAALSCSMATFILFKIFSAYDNGAGNITTLSHPPAAVRLCHSLAMTRKALSTRNWGGDPYEMLLIEPAQDAQNALSRLSPRLGGNDLFVEVDRPATSSYATKLNNHAAKLIKGPWAEHAWLKVEFWS